MPHNPNQPPRPNPADEALQQAAFALQSNRPADAERIAAEVLKRNAGNLRAMQILGHALIVQGRGADAVDTLERAARQTRDPFTETQLAAALRQAGRDDDALTWLERATKRRPPFPPAFGELGTLLMSMNRTVEAIAAMRVGLELAPGIVELALDLGFALLGRNDFKGARDAFSHALSIAPHHPEAIFGAARVAQATGEFQQAADHYRRMLAKNPDDAAARLGLGACLLELKLPDDAFGSFRTVSRTSAAMYGRALVVVASSARGRFWLKPSDAARALGGEQS